MMALMEDAAVPVREGFGIGKEGDVSEVWGKAGDERGMGLDDTRGWF